MFVSCDTRISQENSRAFTSHRRVAGGYLRTLSFLLLSGITMSSAHAVCYVSAGAAGTHSGMSWSTAYADLQSALTNLACTEIWVGKGVYKPTTGTDRTVSFVIKPGTAIYGGFAGTETLRTQRNWLTNVTILSGDIDGNDTSVNGVDVDTTQIVGSNTLTVVYVPPGSSSSTVLDGLTITGGDGGAISGYGGGMYCSGSGDVCSPTISNVVFSGNLADVGGAVFLYGQGSDSSPVMNRVTFTGNHASAGGAFSLQVNDTSSPVFDEVLFKDNTATYGGGAIDAFGFNNVSITRTTFVGNSAAFGGAIEIAGGTTSVKFGNVTFQDNSATGGPGAIWSNDSIDGSTETSTYDNVTISGNSGLSNLINATGAADFHNVIIWNNAVTGVHDTAGLTITHSVIQNGCSTFTGSTKSCTTVSSSDPKLGPLQDNGGFAPTMSAGPGSAIDSGDDTVCAAAPVNGVDERGVVRPQGSHCDVGAVEFIDTIFTDGFE
jgi:predicted outer membrane repeat protein